MGSASAAMVCNGNLSPHRPACGSDLLGTDGREDRDKALREVRYLRGLIDDLASGQQDTTKNKYKLKHKTPFWVAPSTMAEAQNMLNRLKPERKLDFQMLGKLPAATRVTDLAARVALMICSDATELPDWKNRTQTFLMRKPFNDTRFQRIVEAPAVWVSFDCALAGATALLAIKSGELEALGAAAGRATAALLAWDEAVINAVLLAGNKNLGDDILVEAVHDDIWGRAWAGGPHTQFFKLKGE